jgi:hypothetical protein
MRIRVGLFLNPNCEIGKKHTHTHTHTHNTWKIKIQ